MEWSLRWDFTAGNHELIVGTDADETVAEGNGGNNPLAVPVTLGMASVPDLAVLSGVAPTHYADRQPAACEPVTLRVPGS